VHEAAERYFHLLASLEHPSIATVESGSACARCGKGPMKVVEGKPRKNGRRGPAREVCASCEKPWRARYLGGAVGVHGARCSYCGGARIRNRCARCERTWVPESRWRKRSVRRQHVRPGVVDRSEDRGELMDLRRIFEPRPRDMTRADWTAHRMCLAAQAAKSMSVSAIAKEGPKVQPHAPRGWTVDVVRGNLERMEEICEDRLRDAGLWGGPWRERWNDQRGRRWRKPRIDCSAPSRLQAASG